MSKKDSGWWDDFFQAFTPIFSIASRRATNAHIRYVIKKLDLKSGRKFLDCACGPGRIALPMVKKGIRVTGIDITQSYLDEVAKKAKRSGLKIDLQNCDMRRINFDSVFDAGGNLWTSFGYFEKESDNLLVLKKMYRALKPGGKFMLHVINRDWIIANYESTDWFEVKGIKVMQKRSFDYARSINRGTWFFLKDGKEEAFDVNIRMYSYHELIGMFKSVGFVDIEGYGSTKDEPISRDTLMMFIIGTRPKGR